MPIEYRIYPSLGVARVGNAPDEFYIGPDSADELVYPPGGFKDSECRLKRQAVRFRVYEYDTALATGSEITGTVHNIRWTFEPRYRKPCVAPPVVHGASVSGRLDQATASMSIGAAPATPDVVQLGELRTDNEGRLIFLGGFAVCGPIPGVSHPPGSSYPSIAEDSRWYDDCCEGLITAELDFADGKTPITVRAWVVVAPPRSSPHEPPSPSLYEYAVMDLMSRGVAVPDPEPGSPHALDKAQLAFVSANAEEGQGIEIRLTEYVLALSGAPANDPFRVSPGTGLTASLPVPWPWDAYNCDWDLWSIALFADREDFFDNWPSQGVRIRSGTGFIVAERCGADVSVTLLTPSLDFGTVHEGPDGMLGQALQAVVFEVISTGDTVTLEYATPPEPPFSTAAADPGPVGDTGGTTQVARFWIRYETTSDAPASPPLEVVIRWAETGQTWAIPLRAERSPRRTTATALVLDNSGSMNQSAGGGVLKHEAMRNAAKAFLSLVFEGDFIQLVRYDDTAQAIPTADVGGVSSTAVTEIRTVTGVSARDTLMNLIDGPDFDPDGSTSIGAGILQGRERLDDVTVDPVTDEPRRALVILTDGVENTAPYITSVASSVDAATYAVGLGTPLNTSAPALQALAGNHGGYLLITGAITGQNRFLLDKYFLQILADINRFEVALDPDGRLTREREEKIPFHLNEHDAGVEAVLLTTAPRAVDFRLLSPGGGIVEPWVAEAEPSMRFGLSDRLQYYRLALPAEVQSGVLEKAGRWHALLRIGKPSLERPTKVLGNITRRDAKLLVERRAVLSHIERSLFENAQGKNGSGLPYSFLVHAYSSLSLRASFEQDSFEPGANVRIAASLLDSGALPLQDARLKATITGPDGAVDEVSLARVNKKPGHYRATLVASAPGLYRCRLQAEARTNAGSRVTRERALSWAVWRGGDRDAQNPLGTRTGESGGELCALLRCLLAHGKPNSELKAAATRLGIDSEHWESCIDELCRRHGTSPEEVSRRLEARQKKEG